MSEKLIPEGTYLAKPVSWGVNEVGPELKLKLWIKFSNGLFWGRLPEHSDKIAQATRETVKTLGFKGSTLKDLVTNPTALDTDKAVEIVVAHSEYNGKVTAEISFVNGSREYNEAILKRCEQFRIDELDLNQAAAAATGNVKSDPTFTADDIPF